MSTFSVVSCSPPCENGVCVADDVCSCSGGYTGERCEEAMFTACDVNPCENGGNCSMLVGSYICSCPFEYSGSQCQICKLMIVNYSYVSSSKTESYPSGGENRRW